MSVDFGPREERSEGWGEGWSEGRLERSDSKSIIPTSYITTASWSGATTATD